MKIRQYSSILAIFGTFGPFFDIFGPFSPISGLLMTGWWLILDKLGVFWWDLTISIDFRKLYHFQVPKIAKMWVIFGTFDPFFDIFGPFSPISGLPVTGWWLILDKLSVFWWDLTILIDFLPNGKKICNNTEKIQRILRFVSNFKGVGKIMLLGGDMYFLEGGLRAPYNFARKNIFCTLSYT